MANVTIPARHEQTVQQIIQEWYERQPKSDGTPVTLGPHQAVATVDGRLQFLAVPNDVLSWLRARCIPFAVDSQ
jgi:hypothetical protein